MKYVRLGRTGLEVPRVCLGMMSYGDPGWRSWVLPEDQARAPAISSAARARWGSASSVHPWPIIERPRRQRATAVA